jgi:hypothetical protein
MVFWGTYAVSIIAYSYIFTSMGFTNHTLPLAWTYSYPSYRTTLEGRWFSDLLLWLLGGAGVQSSQMYISVALYIIDAILVAEMFGADGGLAIFLPVIFFNVYPANIDRYSFPGNQIVFVMADTFAILAVVILYRQKNTWKALTAATPLFVLCFATYQPAISLAAFLVLAHCVLQVLRSNDKLTVSFPFERLASAMVAMAIGMVLYYVTVKMTISLNTYNTTYVNGVSEAISQIFESFPAFAKYFTVGSDYLPPSLRWLPLAIILLGAASLIFAAWRKDVLSFLAVIFFLGLMPVALRITYIINSHTWANAGRIVYPYGIALLFFLVIIDGLVKSHAAL